MKEEIDREIDELRDLYGKINNLYVVFTPESQKDFVTGKILDYIRDYLRVCVDLLESLKKEIKWNDMWIKFTREGLRELAEKIAKSKEGENK